MYIAQPFGDFIREYTLVPPFEVNELVKTALKRDFFSAIRC